MTPERAELVAYALSQAALYAVVPTMLLALVLGMLAVKK